MPGYVAFLRAINVGGRVVKMDALRHVFESLGFLNVETFIASGNVLFDTASNRAQALERKIEHRVSEALGYEVAVFIRTPADVSAIAGYKPFSQSALDAAVALNIAFVTEPVDDEAEQRLLALRTEIDDFHVHGREIYWLCLKRQSGAKISNAVIEKALGQRATLRGANTIRKLAEKYS